MCRGRGLTCLTLAQAPGRDGVDPWARGPWAQPWAWHPCEAERGGVDFCHCGHFLFPSSRKPGLGNIPPASRWFGQKPAWGPCQAAPAAAVVGQGGGDCRTPCGEWRRMGAHPSGNCGRWGHGSGEEEDPPCPPPAGRQPCPGPPALPRSPFSLVPGPHVSHSSSRSTLPPHPEPLPALFALGGLLLPRRPWALGPP